MDGTGGELLSGALGLAMEPRRALLDDDHHPAFLHPARTVLVLLADTPERDGVRLSAAALLESMEPALVVPPDRVRERLSSRVAEVLEAAPHPIPGEDPGATLERLVTAPPELARLVLAERLDQVRHLHLHPQREFRARVHQETGSLWLPVARRVDPRLARRFEWWWSRVPPGAGPDPRNRRT